MGQWPGAANLGWGPIETLSLVVASLAAFAALTNAAVALYQGLRDTVGLRITLNPDIWGGLSSVLDDYLWVLRIANHTRLPASIERIACRIGSRDAELKTEPDGFHLKQIEPFTVARGWLKVPKAHVRDDSEVVEFTVVQVRGWRRTRRFRFTRGDLVPTKDDLFRQ